jgi:hypothetical protein
MRRPIAVIRHIRNHARKRLFASGGNLSLQGISIQFELRADYHPGMEMGIKQRKKRRRAMAPQFLTRSGQPIDMDAVRESAEKRGIQLLRIGRFIFEFSQLEFSIRAVLVSRLGLKEEHFNIVTGAYDFTKLCNVAREASIVKYPEERGAGQVVQCLSEVK